MEEEKTPMEEIFEAIQDEYCKFDRIENPPSKRPDLCAFMFLDKLFPDKEGDMISASEHDGIYLDFDIKEIESLTEEQFIYLVRCGVRYDYDTESLAMFV